MSEWPEVDASRGRESALRRLQDTARVHLSGHVGTGQAAAAARRRRPCGRVRQERHGE